MREIDDRSGSVHPCKVDGTVYNDGDEADQGLRRDFYWGVCKGVLASPRGETRLPRLHAGQPAHDVVGGTNFVGKSLPQISQISMETSIQGFPGKYSSPCRQFSILYPASTPNPPDHLYWSCRHQLFVLAHNVSIFC